MGSYREQDAIRVILMKSDDGINWYPVGTSAPAKGVREGDCERHIWLSSADGGTTWEA